MSNAKRRKVYRITPLGRAVYLADVERLKRMLRAGGVTSLEPARAEPTPAQEEGMADDGTQGDG